MINLAIMRLRPNAKWTMDNNSYDKLVWLDEEQSKPTKKEVDDEIVKIEDLNRIDQINSKQDDIITKKTMYPIYKQLNIDNQLDPYTFEDKEIKNMFILTVRLIGRQAKENGTLVDDIDWAGLDKIESPNAINFEDIKAIKDRLLNAN